MHPTNETTSTNPTGGLNCRVIVPVGAPSTPLQGEMVYLRCMLIVLK